MTDPLPSVKRESWAENAVLNVIWNGVVKVTVVPLTEAISMTCPTGRSKRENHPREASPGGEAGLHWEMEESVSWSRVTTSPTERPGLLARVRVWVPLTASVARFVDWIRLGHWVPTVMRFEFVPTGILSLVWGGP